MNFYVENVKDYGACGNGVTLDTEAIQEAIDLLAERGGGIIYFPPGVYLSGTIFLKSNITLYLHTQARILGSSNISDYKSVKWGQHIDRTPWHLIAAINVENITLTGGGTIDGNGPAFWEECVPGENEDKSRIFSGSFKNMDPISCVTAREPDKKKARISWIKAHKEARPSPMVEISGCKNVMLNNINLVNSAGWVLHLHNSDVITLDNVTVETNLLGPNNDGFDITGCRDVKITNCKISCCDDAICLKTTPDSRTCERVTISNCIIRTKCVALKFGCAESFFDFRQVAITNCVIYESSRAIGIYTKEGGVVEDVVISNIVCDTRNPFMANRPIHIECTRQSPKSKLGKIRNIQIQNVICRTDGRILLVGQPESMLENIVLRDIQMIYPTIDDPAIACGDIPCGQFSKFNPLVRVARAVVAVENIKNLVLDNLIVVWPETDAEGLIKCHPEWYFDIKAVNGSFDMFYDRSQFNTDRIPDFNIVWGRNVKGGYIKIPLADVPRLSIPKFDLKDSDIHIIDK